ncbi:gliding motility-associated C-terminal domain-containing protein [Chitinophaga pollutisoli]|uniref:Gliding motility-associated C-terminal domain-containing protein n=1 Tax=Chitinophaga pollutisoli TaxID=3133966 RepID=A0ABZ2YVW8_9BACT
MLCPSLHAQTASFSVRDTVCVGSPVTITESSTGVSTWQWNFCSGNSFQPPTAVNHGNPAGFVQAPEHSVIVREGGQFFAFMTNAATQRLVRLDYGSSLANIPVLSTVSHLGAILAGNSSGIQAVEDASGKHLVIVSGDGVTPGKMVRIDFPNGWSDFPAATGVDWGNVGTLLDNCTDLAIVNDNGRNFGFILGKGGNALVMAEFGWDFSAAPAMTATGTPGSIVSPEGIKVFREGANWYAFVAAANGIHLLDFGTSLSNFPTATNLGNFSGMIDGARDIALYQDCEQTFVLVASYNNDAIVRLNFAGGVTGAVTAVTYGNLGGAVNHPSGISKIYRDGASIRAIVANGDPAGSSTSVLTMDGCATPVAPAFSGQTPPAFTIPAAGTYYINLVTDANTPSERFYCRRVVAVTAPALELGNNNIVICNGQPVLKGSITGPRLRYQWYTVGTGPRVYIPGADRSQLTITTTNTYGVEVFNGGCTVSDEILVAIADEINVTGNIQQIDCNHERGSAALTVTGGNSPYTFSLNSAPKVALGNFSDLNAGNYTVNIEDQYGCTGTYSFAIARDLLRTLTTSATGTNPTCFGGSNGAILAQVSLGTTPIQFALGTGPFGNGPSFNSLTAGTYKVYIRNAYCLDSQEVVLTQPTALLMPYDVYQDTCNRGNGWVRLSPQGGVSPYSVTWNGNVIARPEVDGLGVGMYTANVMDANGCQRSANIYVGNLSMSRMNILTPDTVVAIGDAFVIRADNAADYIWSPIDVGGIRCPTCPETVVRPVAPTQYIVRTLTGANCVSADTVRVMIDYSSMLEMPNAFSPNNDGMNDFFRPKSKAVMAFSMQVYNRSGNLVFTTNDHRRGWDGNVNGKPAPMGTYVYIIKFGFWQADGKMELFDKKGTFDLIR